MQFISCHDGKLQILSPQEFRAPTAQAFTTGLTALDALAPGGAFARGAVHEILTASENGPALFFATLLARASATPVAPEKLSPSPGTPAFGSEAQARRGEGRDGGLTAFKPASELSLTKAPHPDLPAHQEKLPQDSHTPQRFICWCDPKREIYPPALANRGIPLTHLLLLHPQGPQDLLWAISESLRCKGVAAVVAAPPRLSRIAARRLQLSAERGGSVGLLLRSTNAPGIDCYAAATRWLVRPEHGERTVQRWNVQLIHGHGGCIGKTVILEVCRENNSVRALESLAHRSVEKSQAPRVA